MNKYSYSGPVMEFGACIQNKWEGSTMASSEKQAKNNLAYQWKKKHGRTPDSRITLPGRLYLAD